MSDALCGWEWKEALALAVFVSFDVYGESDMNSTNGRMFLSCSPSLIECTFG